MKTISRFMLLAVIVVVGLGCEPTQIPCIEGKWEAITPHNRDNYEVIITDNMIHLYPPTTPKSCKYTISKDYLHIVRLWKSETDMDYTADCQYHLYGDTLVICDFTLTLVATNPPQYADLTLVRSQK